MKPTQPESSQQPGPHPSSQAQPAPSPEPAAPPPPLLELRDGLPPVVSTASDLARTVTDLAAGSGPVAIDAERASGYRYGQRAYLVQLRRAGAGTALVDPVPFRVDASRLSQPTRPLQALSDAVADAEWIIHAASQDLPSLGELGLWPARLFDTELAGRLLNYPRVGLAVLVEELLGYRMRKEHSAVDWSRRPLPASWLLYAALDVEMLIELRDVLAGQLVDADKAEWARQEFAALAAAGPQPPRTDPWRRTSGMHRVRGRRSLAIVRELWQTRDMLARRRDVTPNRILADAAIVEAAQAAPTSRRELAALPAFSVRGAQRHLRDFHAAVSTAQALPDRELPHVAPQHDGPPPPRTWSSRDPAAADRLMRCRETVTSLAADLELPQENLLAPDAVRRLAWRPPQPPTQDSVAAALADFGARPWQRELTAAALADALDDPVGDGVADDHTDPQSDLPAGPQTGPMNDSGLTR